MTGNADQIQYWNIQGRKWAAMQERIDLTMNEITDAVLPFANAKPGERIIDIGCGCGTTTLRLAMIAGREGSVAGVDVSVPMLAVAEARAQASQAEIAFVEADASTYEFQPNADLVFSRFGVMFFADPYAAFKNIRTALSRTGRIAFVCWRTFPENIWASAPFFAARDLLPEAPPADPYAPGPFALGDGARTEDILEKAGFNNVRLEKLDCTMNMGADLDAASSQALEIGPLARAATELNEAQREQLKARAAQALSKYVTASGVRPPAACWLAGATA
ncbi:MAG: methyltransferase domain-containing protein [Alphaproteobacteria bacterium]|nr:methyltransferase domain-containing protein [Alphaproteobacteria bacterium]